MSDMQMKIIRKGIELKLAKGEELEDILSSYKNLSADEKNILREFFREK